MTLRGSRSFHSPNEDPLAGPRVLTYALASALFWGAVLWMVIR